MDKLIEKLRDDREIEKTMYMFDYKNNWYNRDFHKSNKQMEHEVDKTLSFYSYVCYLKKKKIIAEDDFEFFNYQITRIANNYSVQNYMFNLYHFANAQKTKLSFYYLFEYCYENYLFEENKNEIKNPESRKYQKYLNF